MQDSHALVLEILKQDKALKMSVFERRELVSTLRHYSQCAIAAAEIDSLCQEVVAILNRPGAKAALGQDLSRELSRAGQLLWSHLLSRPAKERLKSSQVSDLILSIDEELINIPWELLYDGANFLCLKFNLGRLVRTKQEASGVQYRSPPGVPKMLILADPTADLKAAYREGLNIKNQFDRRRNNVRINFKSTSIDRLYVKKNICDHDIVHFAGHCEYEPDNPKNSGWVLSDGAFTVEDILAMGSAASLPALVFSNACYSARGGGGLMDADYQEKSYSMASAFLFSGARHYIGAIRKIEDPLSLAFSKEFYAHLISGRPVGECVRLSRLRLVKEYGIGSLCWAGYLLYGDPDFVLFRAQAKPAPSRAKKIPLLNKKRLSYLSLAAAVISICIYLYIWLPSLNPGAYFLFLRLKKLSAKGTNQELVSLGSRIIKEDPLFLAVYPLVAQAYQRSGDRQGALKYYYDYVIYSEKKGDKKNLASSYINLGWFYHLEGEYQKAEDFYNKAVALAQEARDKLNEAVALRKLAVWNIDKRDYARALELLTKSSEINRQNQHSREHKYNLACDYFDIGLVFSNKDDFTAAREFYNKSRLIFDGLKFKDELSDYYFNLGEICLFEKQYQKALEYYLAGLKIDEDKGSKMNLASDYNMLGELYVEMDNLAEAESRFKAAAAVSKEINALPELADACFNLGLLYKKKGYKNKAREALRQAQEIYRTRDSFSYEEVKKELLGLDNS